MTALLSQKPIANPVVVLREESDDWALLFNPDTDQVVGTNPTGVEIWRLLDGTRTIAQIATQLREHLDDVPDAVDDEVNDFVSGLAARGFVELAPESDAG